jgi:hypothetical protein
MRSIQFLVFLLITACSHHGTFVTTPWKNHLQQIPGRVQCEHYDQGGEGVAYHDTDSINNGSGKLNPVNGNPLNEFRLVEGVDISYTKSKDIDNNPYNNVEPEMDQLYVGWTQPGEWIRYTVDVKESGIYQLSLMYTAHDDGTIAFDVDGVRVTNDLVVQSTFNASDTIPWRQWHHWNKIGFTGINLEKGIRVLTLHTVTVGNMNYDYLEFKKQD